MNFPAAYPAPEDGIKRKPSWSASTVGVCTCGGSCPSAHNSRVVGTPETIADQLEQWRDAGVDGINVVNATIPGSYEEFVDHVTAVLQDRGLAQREYAPGTTRAKLFGHDLLSERHPAAQYRGAFTPVEA